MIENIRFIRRRWPVFLTDAILVSLAWLLAYWFRFNLHYIPPSTTSAALQYLPLVVLAHLGAGMLFGFHRIAWRFVSATDIGRLIKSTVVGAVIVAGVLLLLDRWTTVPRSVLVLHAVLVFLFLGGSRVVYRWIREREGERPDGQRVLLVGAGQAGEMLVRDMRRTTPPRYQIVGIVDDDSARHGRDIRGVRVLGAVDDLPAIAKQTDADRIVIAIPSASASEMRRLVAKCEATSLPYRTLPKVMDVVDGTVDSSDVKRVEIEDLLGRDPVSLDHGAIGAGLSDKRVLVTGAGGSIGSELCRQIQRHGARELILFERNEFNLYSIQQELMAVDSSTHVTYILGDVCDAPAVDTLFRTHKPDIVFHAAAYKHVPLLEGQIRESVRNNVIGTACVADAADAAGCERFVLISTDKAVNPSSAMGACKRVAEIYCRALGSASTTKFLTVRFGNVLGSAGSVVPLFRQQIEAGGPVTVTHRDVTRYFMTIAESCQLILQASSVGEGGEIFVLDMGEPISITYLAQQMIRLSGKQPGADIEIVYTGLRTGEKLEETLFHNDEPSSQTGYPKLLLAQSRSVDAERTKAVVLAMSGAVDKFDEAPLPALVRELVPEYSGAPAGVVSKNDGGS